MMLMLPLLAIALAVPPKRSTSARSASSSAIVMVVTYHKINQYAESAGAQGRLDAGTGAVAAVPGVRRADRLDVPRHRPSPRRPADRRARSGLRQARQG